jgi:dynein heavy chain, axonemal
LIRAEKLINGLVGESTRWLSNVQRIQGELFNLVGDYLVSSAFVAYVGSFGWSFRGKIMDKLVEITSSQGINVSEDFKIEKVISSEIEIQNWLNNQLPNDQLSIQNAIIIHSTLKHALIIDPQLQAQGYLSTLLLPSSLHKIRHLDLHHFVTVQQCIQFGYSLMVQDFNGLDQVYEQVFKREWLRKQSQWVVKFGDQEIIVNQAFKIYLF